MTPGARTVREEHQGFQLQVDAILHVADSVGVVPVEVLLEKTGEIHEFLAHSLMPHAAEDLILFPALREVRTRADRDGRCHRRLGSSPTTGGRAQTPRARENPRCR
jgi:hypothetical protein